LASGEVANFVTLFANESTHQVILNELGDIFGKIRRTDLAKIRLPILAYYQSIGLSQNRIEEGKDTFSTFVWNTYDDLLENRGTSFKNLKKWFEWSQKLDYQLQEQGEGGASFHKKTEIIYQDILQMLNDEENTFTKIYIDWKKSTEGEFVIVKNGNNLKENQLSSGEKLLFTLVADISYKLALANPSSLNPSKEGTGIVLIDEIDLHLHPKWQRKVVTKLREIFPNVQFVITTHSPVILTELYSKHIRVLDNGHIFGIRDSFGHSEEEMLEEMGGQSERKKLIKEIHRLLAQNKISEAKEKRAKIEVEGDFAPLLEIDLFIQRKEKATL
jgi:predicted ATP-binding protein involved in virulence